MAEKKDDKKKPAEAAAEGADGAPKKKPKIILFVLIFVGVLIIAGGSVGATLYLTGFFKSKPAAEASAEGEEGAEGGHAGGEHGSAEHGGGEHGGGEAKAGAEHGGGEHGGGEHGGGEKKSDKELPKNEKFSATYKAIERDFTLNVPNSRKFVQFKVAYKTFFGERIVERVTKHLIAVEAAIISAAGQFSEEEMTSPDGRVRLAVALRDAMNDVLIRNEDFGGIEEVMFTSFVFQ
jgi:flagellar FliL protein